MDFDEIQGNVVAGFNTRYQSFVALTIRVGADQAAAARWLGSLAPALSTVNDVRDARGNMLAAAGDTPPWLAVAVSQRVINAVLPAVTLSDPMFRAGMAQTRLAIGDETSPDGWVVGSSQAPVDALLIVASNDPEAAEARATSLAGQAQGAGFDCSYKEAGVRLPGEREHFGFKDGISQPSIAGDQSLDGMPPGFFVFGYPKVPGGPPVTNPLDPVGFTTHGSLLVFRRLAQDTARFAEFFQDEAARLRPNWAELTPEWLAALVVGRWPSGAPASVRVPVDPGPGPADNDFDFHDDLDAARCPFGAHIRKVNPRESNRDVVDVPRILRRGIPFGPAAPAVAPAGRGLLFVAYQTSIRDQFAFIASNWMNRSDRPQPGGGYDLLVGRAAGVRSMPVNGPHGPVEIVLDIAQWITPTGGAYLFVPGRSALAMLSLPPPARDVQLRDSRLHAPRRSAVRTAKQRTGH